MKDSAVPAPLAWPSDKQFVFTIFDDPDSQSWKAGREVYALLRDLGFRTTKGLWPMEPIREPSDHGLTCGHPGYSEWIHSLVECGFEAGYHNATSHTCTREESSRGLDLFHSQFGKYPRTMAQHYDCDENLYWGDARVSGWHRTAYNLLTRYRNHNKYMGHVEGSLITGGTYSGTVLNTAAASHFRRLIPGRRGPSFLTMTVSDRWCRFGTPQVKAPIENAFVKLSQNGTKSS